MTRVAFVTGATGFVGINLVDELLARGWGVIALHRPSSDVAELARRAVERRCADLRDADHVLEVMPSGLTVVFHLAGDTGMWSGRDAEQTATNVDGTRHVVAAALARGAGRLIHTSSIAAWGRQTGTIDETTPSHAARSPINYERSKWLGEEAVRAGIARGLDAVILNPCAIIGPHDTRGWARMLIALQQGKLPFVPPGVNTFCHVREVVRAQVRAVEAGRRGANYILGGEQASYAELIGLMAELLGRQPPRLHLPRGALHALARLAAAGSWLLRRPPPLTREMAEFLSSRCVCDDTRARSELGYRHAPLREALADSYRWLAAKGTFSISS